MQILYNIGVFKPANMFLWVKKKASRLLINMLQIIITLSSRKSWQLSHLSLSSSHRYLPYHSIRCQQFRLVV